MKLKNSLLSKYILIILMALIILPVSVPIISIIFYMPLSSGDKDIPNIYQNGIDLEKMWHKEAKKLAGASEEKVNERIKKIHQTYTKADMFWVNQKGETKAKIPQKLSIPEQWDPVYTIEFMKKNYDGDPYTVVAFIGEQKNEGFMVMQVPRSEMISNGEILRERYNYVMIIVTLVILGLFIFTSWIFFYKMRKRLLHVQEAMKSPDNKGVPHPIKIKKYDEIGQLEQAFNDMIHQLQQSRKREKEEEDLRKQLIANLSHDIRTPLTMIRSHAYSLKKESLSDQGKDSLQLIDGKISYLSQLIENLLSYTLLSSGKYPYHPQKLEMNRKLRSILAHWYPVYESAGFEMELEIPETPIYWEVDVQWFERVIDNLLQNINRHAQTGKYIGVKILKKYETDCLVVEDHGPGMTGDSSGKGAGIGLSIVSLMMKEMKLNWEIDSSSEGTKIYIWTKRN